MYKLNIVLIKTNFRNCSKMLSLMAILYMFSCQDNDDSYNSISIKQFPGREQDFSLWQLESFYDEVQMGYIIRTDDDKIIVIDGGGLKSASIVEEYLRQLGGEVDTWIITHPHMDHIGVPLKIIENKKIKINRLLHSAIEEDWVRIHEEKAHNNVVNYNDIIKKSSISIVDVSIGETFKLGTGVEMQVLGTRNEKITTNAINNSSLVFKIVSNSKSVLFLGDLGPEGGDIILKRQNANEIQADYVQMAHHGQNGVNRKFYEAVNAEYALWPTPKWLWNNNLNNRGMNTGKWKTLTVREWMADLNIKKNFVGGIEGTIQID